MRRVVFIAALLAVAGCHGTQPVAAPPTVQYKSRFEGALAASAFDSAAADSPFSEVSDARGIPNLRTVQLPTDTREIRIAGGYSMQANAPSPMLRVVQTPLTVKGEVYFFWSERPGDPRHYPQGRRINCTVAERRVRTCMTLGELPVGFDWARVAADLAALGAWTVHDSCADGMSYSDSGELMIQRLTGRQFDKFACNAPEQRSGTEAGRRALAIYQYFRQLVAKAT